MRFGNLVVLVAAVLALVGCAGLTNSPFPVLLQECVNRMREVNQGLMMYAADYDDTLPIGADWMDRVDQYVSPNSDFQCPVVEANNPAEFGVAMHTQIDGQTLDSFPDRSLIITLFESTDLSESALGTEADKPPVARHNDHNVLARLNGAVQHVVP
jgi:hypothetical protein